MIRLVCVLFVCVSVCSGNDAKKAWEKFRQQKYAEPVVTQGVGDSGEAILIVEDNILNLEDSEEKVRFTHFKKSFELVNKINSQDLGFGAEVNEMSDLSEAEWNSNMMGLNMSMFNEDDTISGPVSEEVGSDPREVPETLDWVEKGMLTGIKFQGVCGACWAFAATTCLESHYAIYGGNLKFMSEQQMLDCVYIGDDACDGGWYSDGWRTIRKTLANQYPTESSYRYLGKTMKCDKKRGDNALVAATIDYPQIVKVEYVTNQRGQKYYDQKLADAVSIGPVAVAMRVEETFKVYKRGLYSEKYCSSIPNHAVVVVGYKPDRFKVRNSWGTTWGEEGYVWFDRRVQNQCSIAQYGEYPLLKVTGVADNNKKKVSCATLTCLNGGTCNDRGKTVSCTCTPGYSGKFCEEKICANVLPRCPRTSASPFCKRRKYQIKCPESCGTCYN